jgi:hypothetical protein
MPALPAISMVAGLIGTGVSVYSSIEQGKAQNRLAQYNAQMAEREAKLAERRGQLAAEAQRASGKALLARQRAGFAASGVVADVGSPLLVQAQQAGYAEQAVLQGLETGGAESDALNQQAVLDRYSGASAVSASKTNAFGTILQGTASFAKTGAENRRITKSFWG